MNWTALAALTLTFLIAALMALPSWRLAYSPVIDRWANDVLPRLSKASNPGNLDKAKPSFEKLTDTVGVLSGALVFGIGLTVLPGGLDRDLVGISIAGIVIIVISFLIAGYLYNSQNARYLRTLAIALVVANLLAIAGTWWISSTNLGRRPVELVSANNIISDIDVVPNTLTPTMKDASSYHVSGKLKLDRSELAGRVIWVANRVGEAKNLSTLDIDAFNNNSCSLVGADGETSWGCDILMGQAGETNQKFTVYVFLANGETVSAIKNGKAPTVEPNDLYDPKDVVRR